MISHNYIHEFDDKIRQFEMRQSDQTFFNEQFDILSYYDRKIHDAVLFY